MESEIKILTSDNFSLAATEFIPEERRESVIIINAAMAVPRRFYSSYARHLSDLVVTYDYRGIGDSRPPSLKGFQAKMRDWAELDIIEWVSSTYKPEKLFLIGHSLGGQTAGLLSMSQQINGMVTLSAQSGYWGLQPSLEKYRAWFVVTIVFPLVSRAFGYFPWSRLASGADLPKDIALEWASWCRSPDYIFGDKTLDSLQNFRNFSAPILAYSFSDDVWGSQRSVDNMMARYIAADVERRHISPQAIGGEKIGHLGFFLPKAEGLWHEVDEWIEKQE